MEFGPVDAVITDPPYGISYKVNRRPRASGTGLHAIAATPSESRPAVHGDDAPFDPVRWLGLAPKVALFGADHFASRLPDAGRWIVWDKRRDSKPDDHSDGEVVWLNQAGVLRFHRQKWRGLVREGEENCSNGPKQHQNQKPVALLAYIMAELGLIPGQTVLDPFMGSGTTGVACVRRGLKFIGVEIDGAHFATATRRIAAG